MENRQIVQAREINSLAWEGIKSDKDAVVNRIRSMIVNGKKLQDPEVFALTAYSLANDLNPFNGEAYFMPGAGPVPGIQGYRKKSKMALKQEAQAANVRAPFYTEEYRLITDPAEAGHDPEKGDLAYECSISDNVSAQGHADIMSDVMGKLVAAGVDVDKAYHAALKVAGSPPRWTGIGIVYADENFGSTEKFSRHERAMKRAAKLAIKKRWPSLDIPVEPQGVDVDYVPVISIEEPDQDEAPKVKRSNDEILTELGFSPQEAKAKIVEEDNVEEGEYKEVTDEDLDQLEEELAEDEGDALEAMEAPKTIGELYRMATQGLIPNIGLKTAKDAVEQANKQIEVAWEIVKDLSRGLGNPNPS
jgi:hypothetical protein